MILNGSEVGQAIVTFFNCKLCPIDGATKLHVCTNPDRLVPDDDFSTGNIVHTCNGIHAISRNLVFDLCTSIRDFVRIKRADRSYAAESEFLELDRISLKKSVHNIRHKNCKTIGDGTKR